MQIFQLKRASAVIQKATKNDGRKKNGIFLINTGRLRAHFLVWLTRRKVELGFDF